ncbi:MAG TPA: aldose epimerase family protein [Polyangia bacterium]|nr:aldose epimerase family protein [Polyangia bacterium]
MRRRNSFVHASIVLLAAALCVGLGSRAAAAGKTKIARARYGTVDGKPVDVYTLTNARGAFARITNYGAIVTELHVPDRAGKLGDVVLGFDKLDDYVASSPYFGAIVGRVANRIANATFALDGKSYTLNANNPPHHLHGGKKGWDKVIWTAEPKQTKDGPSLRLTHVSPDGEENYPGTVTATATYTLTNDDELRVEMTATTDKTTVVSMAHHSYWNLAGGGTILEHELQIPAGAYTPGAPMVPDGTTRPVKGTPFDFTTPKPIGRDLKRAGGTPVGFDHNWVVDGDPHAMRLVARLKDPSSGRVLTISADQPGLQFYSGNFLDGKTSGKGVRHAQYAGLCLESQKFPNAVNVPAWRDQVVLRPGQTYRHTMVHKFTAE